MPTPPTREGADHRIGEERSSPAHVLTTDRRSDSARASWLIFCWLGLFYTLCTSGRVDTPDGAAMGQVAYSIAHGDGLAVAAGGFPEGFLFPGLDGRLYCKYGAGLPFVSVPAALVGSALERLVPSYAVDLFAGPRIRWSRPGDPSQAWHFFAVGLVSAWIAAATCALLHALLRRIGFGGRSAALATAVIAIGSPLWPYAKDYFAEPLGGLGLVVFAWSLESMRGEEESGPRLARDDARRTLGFALLAGFGLGLAVLAKIALAALLPAAAYVVVALLRNRSQAAGAGSESARDERAASIGGSQGEGGPSRLARTLVLIAGGTIPVLVVLAYNHVRFGNPFTTGYEWELRRWDTPALRGIYGLLLSPGHGLAAYFPAAILAAACTPRAWRRAPAWTLFTWLCVALTVAFYCRWYAWEGGWCWGPRFLLPVLPFFGILIAAFFETPPRARVLRLAGWALILAGLWIAFTGTLVSSVLYHQGVMEKTGDAFPGNVLWNRAFYPPVTYPGFTPKGLYFFVGCLRSPAGWWLAFLAGFAAVSLVPLGRSAWSAAIGTGPGRRASIGRGAGPGRRAWTRWGAVLARRGWGWTAWAAAAIVAGTTCALVSWTSAPHVVLDFPFQRSTYGTGWETEGNAFAGGPCLVDSLPAEAQNAAAGLCSRVIYTAAAGGDPAVGVLRSPEFVIRGARAAFQLGGGRDIERLGVRLIVDGRMVLRTTGPGRDVLGTGIWDVRPYLGRRARLEVFDESVDPGGHLMLREFRITR